MPGLSLKLLADKGAAGKHQRQLLPVTGIQQLVQLLQVGIGPGAKYPLAGGLQSLLQRGRKCGGGEFESMHDGPLR